MKVVLQRVKEGGVYIESKKYTDENYLKFYKRLLQNYK